MRDFKCVACKIRTRRAGDSAHDAGDACPGCGSPLEPVGELAEIVGFRWVTTTTATRSTPRGSATRWLLSAGWTAACDESA